MSLGSKDRRRFAHGAIILAVAAGSIGAIWFVARPKTVERNPIVEARLHTASIALIGALESGRDAKDAVAAYRRVLEVDADCLAGIKGLGISCVAARQTSEGIERLLSYLKRAPDDPEAHLWVARGYRVEGNSDLAVYYFERSRALDRQGVEVRRELAKLLIERRKHIEAVSILQEGLALSPKDEELNRLMTAAMGMQTSLAHDAETRSPARVGPETPDPLAEIKKSNRP